jgi:hypothetical protein
MLPALLSYAGFDHGGAELRNTVGRQQVEPTAATAPHLVSRGTDPAREHMESQSELHRRRPEDRPVVYT